MPLTPAEVHNVAFKKPPIGKRGYDEEEVDAFLDIVEVELSRLLEENQDLRARMSAGETLPAEPAQASPVDGADAAELASVRDENGRLRSQIAELERALSGKKNDAQQQVLQLQQQLAVTEQQLAENRRSLEEAQRLTAAAPAAPGSAGASTGDNAQQAVAILAMAQQTADQHLAQSKAEADRLLSEARSNAETTVNEANARAEETISKANAQAEETISKANAQAETTTSEADQRAGAQLAEADQQAKQLAEQSSAQARQTIAEAEERAASITAQFEQRKADLERRIEELRVFEREYRSRLKNYLESQLRDLVGAERSEPADEDPAAGPGADPALADAAQA